MNYQIKPIQLGSMVLVDFTAGCSVFGNSPQSSIRGFFSAVEKGEISQAKSYLSTNFTAIGDDKLNLVLTELTKEIERCEGIKKLTIEMTDNEWVSREANTEIDYESCPTEESAFTLLKEDGE
jgi:hypothetical protein